MSERHTEILGSHCVDKPGRINGKYHVPMETNVMSDIGGEVDVIIG